MNKMKLISIILLFSCLSISLNGQFAFLNFENKLIVGPDNIYPQYTFQHEYYVNLLEDLKYEILDEINIQSNNGIINDKPTFKVSQPFLKDDESLIEATNHSVEALEEDITTIAEFQLYWDEWFENRNFYYEKIEEFITIKNLTRYRIISIDGIVIEASNLKLFKGNELIKWEEFSEEKIDLKISIRTKANESTWNWEFIEKRGCPTSYKENIEGCLNNVSISNLANQIDVTPIILDKELEEVLIEKIEAK